MPYVFYSLRGVLLYLSAGILVGGFFFFLLRRLLQTEKARRKSVVVLAAFTLLLTIAALCAATGYILGYYSAFHHSQCLSSAGNALYTSAVLEELYKGNTSGVANLLESHLDVSILEHDGYLMNKFWIYDPHGMKSKAIPSAMKAVAEFRSKHPSPTDFYKRSEHRDAIDRVLETYTMSVEPRPEADKK